VPRANAAAANADAAQHAASELRRAAQLLWAPLLREEEPHGAPLPREPQLLRAPPPHEEEPHAAPPVLWALQLLRAPSPRGEDEEEPLEALLPWALQLPRPPHAAPAAPK